MPSIKVLSTPDLNNNTIKNYADDGSRVFDPRHYGAKIDGVTDDADAWEALWEAWYEQGGGRVFVPAGISLCSKAWVIPHDGHFTNPASPGLVIFGVGGNKNARQGTIQQKGSVLKLTYDGSDGLHNAKFNMYSTSGARISDIMFCSDETDDFSFIFASYPTVIYDGISFQGKLSRNASNAVDFPRTDCIILGYDQVDGKFSLDSNGFGKHMNFQGYGTMVQNCFGHKIRSLVVLGNDCNAITLLNNKTTRSCGSDDLMYGAIYRLSAGDRHGASGNSFSFGTGECRGYRYAFQFGKPVWTPVDYQPLLYRQTQETQFADGASDYTITTWATLDPTKLGYTPLATTNEGILVDLAAYNVDDEIIDINTDSTITLPACAGHAGKVVRFRRSSGGTGHFTIVASGSDTITYAPLTSTNLQEDLLDTQYQDLTLKVNADGDGWEQSYLGTAESQTCTGDYTVAPWIICPVIFLEVGQDHYGGDVVPLTADSTITLPACADNAGKIVLMKRIDPAVNGSTEPGNYSVTVEADGTDTIEYLDATDTNLQDETLNNQSRLLALQVKDDESGWIQIDARSATYKYNVTQQFGIYDEADNNVNATGSGLPSFTTSGYAYHNHLSVFNFHNPSFMSALLGLFTVDNPDLGNFSGVYGLLSGEGYQNNQCLSMNPYHPTYLFNPVHFTNIQTRTITTVTRFRPTGTNLDITTGSSGGAINLTAGATVFKDPLGDTLGTLAHSTSSGLTLTGRMRFENEVRYNTLFDPYTIVTYDTTGTKNLDFTVNSKYRINLNESVTLTFTDPPTANTGQEITLLVRMGSTPKTITFPSNIKWQNSGTVPTLLTGLGKLTLIKLEWADANEYLGTWMPLN